METWRIIFDGVRSASFNMAADACLLRQAEAGETVPTIRLYGWDKPSISIGYHQRLERAVAESFLDGTPVVRRITGGRALFHDDGELTYAVAGNFRRHPILGGSLHDSYRLIACGIVAFYRKLGWDADMERGDRAVSLSGGRAVQAGCFAAVSRYEITVGGRKMAAGSQRRTVGSLVQHGAVKISAPAHHPAIHDGSEVVDWESIRPIGGRRQDLERRLAAALADSFGVLLEARPLDSEELAGISDNMTRFKNLNVGRFD